MMVTEVVVSRADSTSVSPQPSGESPRPSDDSPDPGPDPGSDPGPGPDPGSGSDPGSGAGPSAADGGALTRCVLCLPVLMHGMHCSLVCSVGMRVLRACCSSDCMKMHGMTVARSAAHSTTDICHRAVVTLVSASALCLLPLSIHQS